MTFIHANLRSICLTNPQYGANASAIDWNENKPRYVRITDISDDGDLLNDDIKSLSLNNWEDYKLECGDLLFARSGATVGKTLLYKPEYGQCAFAGYLIRFKLNKKIVVPEFVNFFTKTEHYRNWILSKKRSAAQPNINGKEYSSLELKIPTISEQRRIVELLDQADEIRKLRKQADEKAEKIIPALFYEMFGDIRENPNGFEKKKIGDVLKVKSGNFLTSAMMKKEGEFPVYGGNGINGYHNEYMFNDSKIIIGRVGAYCGNVFYSKPKSWITDNALYVSEKTDDLIDEFLMYQLRMLNLNQYAGRAGQPLVSGNRIYPIEILLPGKGLQEIFVKRLNDLDIVTELKDTSRQKISNLFDVLLEKAFDESLTASWREAHMKELLQEMEEQKKYLEKKN